MIPTPRDTNNIAHEPHKIAMRKGEREEEEGEEGAKDAEDEEEKERWLPVDDLMPARMRV